MERNTSYNTKQKELIIKTIKNKKNEFTIKDIYTELNKKVGLTTIYRLFDNLEKENFFTKRIGKDGTTYYQYLEKCDHNNHFYLKCDNCHHLVHIDCDCITGLTMHITKNHKFKPTNDIIINGICKNCIKENKEMKVC